MMSGFITYSNIYKSKYYWHFNFTTSTLNQLTLETKSHLGFPNSSYPLKPNPLALHIASAKTGKQKLKQISRENFIDIKHH